MAAKKNTDDFIDLAMAVAKIGSAALNGREADERKQNQLTSEAYHKAEEQGISYWTKQPKMPAMSSSWESDTARAEREAYLDTGRRAQEAAKQGINYWTKQPLTSDNFLYNAPSGNTLSGRELDEQRGNQATYHNYYKSALNGKNYWNDEDLTIPEKELDGFISGLMGYSQKYIVGSPENTDLGRRGDVASEQFQKISRLKDKLVSDNAQRAEEEKRQAQVLQIAGQMAGQNAANIAYDQQVLNKVEEGPITPLEPVSPLLYNTVVQDEQEKQLNAFETYNTDLENLFLYTHDLTPEQAQSVSSVISQNREAIKESRETLKANQTARSELEQYQAANSREVDERKGNLKYSEVFDGNGRAAVYKENIAEQDPSFNYNVNVGGAKGKEQYDYLQAQDGVIGEPTRLSNADGVTFIWEKENDPNYTRSKSAIGLMSPKEIKTFQYYLGRYGEADALGYLNNILPQLEKKAYNIALENMEDDAFGSLYGPTILPFTNGMHLVDNVSALFSGKPPSEYTGARGAENMAKEARKNYINKHFDPFWGGFVDGGLNLLDFAADQLFSMIPVVGPINKYAGKAADFMDIGYYKDQDKFGEAIIDLVGMSPELKRK